MPNFADNTAKNITLLKLKHTLHDSMVLIIPHFHYFLIS